MPRQKKKSPTFSRPTWGLSPAGPDDCLFVGIDPGKSGAIAVVDSTNKPWSSAVPMTTIVEAGEARNCYDAQEMHRIIKWLAIRRSQEKKLVKVYIEGQAGRPTTAKKAVLEMGIGLGHWYCLLRLYGFYVNIVQPVSWKAFYGLKGTGLTKPQFKAMSMGLCTEMYPSFQPKLAKEEGQAEAILIADYAKRQFLKA